jgi:hypothetical protein
MKEAVVGHAAESEVVRGARAGLISGGVISSYRAILVERDLWGHVRARFALRGEHDEGWLDAISARDWVEVESFVTLLDVIAETMGVDELRWLVRKRIVDPAGSNFYAAILRSWARSFGQSPENMLRGVVHVWRAALRNAGRVHHLPVREGEVHLLIEGPLERIYRQSPALGAELEGMAFSLLDSAQPRPMFIEVELRTQQSPIALVCTFGN